MNKQRPRKNKKANEKQEKLTSLPMKCAGSRSEHWCYKLIDYNNLSEIELNWALDSFISEAKPEPLDDDNEESLQS